MIMKKIYLALLLLAGTAITTEAQQAIRTRHFNTEKGIAIKGYDPVAYFTDNKAVKGNKQWAAIAEGVTYYFSSASHKDLFLKNFSRYEPQYGGWCAYAMGASGEKVDIDPETFKIRDGRLYLFYHSFFNNTLTKWNKDESRLKVNADASWTNIFH
jgi:YHS domain-containing protein